MPPTDPTPDIDLLRAFARGGDERAFCGLTERYAGLVFSAALRRTRQHSLAEEVTQNVFAVLARKAAALAAPEVKLAAWLHRAAVLEATRALRKELTRQRIMHSYFDQADALAAEADPAWHAALPELDTALDSLPGRDRELLLARFFENKSYRELAATTGKSEAALMQQQRRALEKLSTLLRRRGAAVPVATLGAVLGGSLAQAAPVGLAASVAAAAPAAAASLGSGALFWHSLDILMQTKTKTLLAGTVAACFLGGTAAFVAAERAAEARGVPLASFPAAVPLPPAPVSAAVSVTAGLPLDLRAKLDRAAAGWRGNTEHRLRMKALEVFDVLAPTDVPLALAFLASVKDEPALWQALAARIAVLWGASQPKEALAWLSTDVPKAQRGDPMQAILTDWALREPEQALAWWQGVQDSLQFPIAENAFERLESVIYHGWAVKDPAGFVATLPRFTDLRDFDEEGGVGLYALGCAASDPATRDALVEAVRGLEPQGTKAAALLMLVSMFVGTEYDAAESIVLQTAYESEALREHVLTRFAVLAMKAQGKAPRDAITWLEPRLGGDRARRAIANYTVESGRRAGEAPDGHSENQ